MTARMVYVTPTVSRRWFLFGTAAAIVAPAIPDIVPKLVSEPQWTFEPVPPGIYTAEIVSVDLEAERGFLAVNFKVLGENKIVRHMIRLDPLPPMDWREEPDEDELNDY